LGENSDSVDSDVDSDVDFDVESSGSEAIEV
jgi:hypothetical protein